MQIPNIMHAYENIKNACDKRIQQIYPLGIPEVVETRYKKELEFLKTSKYIDDFEIFRRLNEEAVKCSQILSMKGTVTSSYLVYLLSRSLLNPLPTHYYCPKCGRFEIVDTKLFGIDLPISKCPECNAELIADGFNLPLEMVWGIDGKKVISFDYNISEEFFPFAKRVLQSLYPDNVITPLGLHNRLPEENDIRIIQSGFLILPKGQTTEDYPEMTAYLEDGEICLSGNKLETERHYIHRVLLTQNKWIEHIIALQRKNGIYANEITLQDLRTLNWNDLNNTTALTDTESSLFCIFKPKTFYDMTCLDAASHNAYSNKEYSVLNDNNYSLSKDFETPQFKKYPCYTEEDFFDELLKMGFSTDKAFEITEFIKKGRQNSCSEKYSEEFDSFDIPEDFKSVAKQYLYLFPRCHSAEYILMYAKIAYYGKKDSRIFSSIVLKKRK